MGNHEVHPGALEFYLNDISHRFNTYLTCHWSPLFIPTESGDEPALPAFPPLIQPVQSDHIPATNAQTHTLLEPFFIKPAVTKSCIPPTQRDGLGRSAFRPFAFVVPANLSARSCGMWHLSLFAQGFSLGDFPIVRFLAYTYHP